MVRPVIRVPYTEDPSRVGPADIASTGSGRPHIMSKVPSLMFDMEDTEESAPVAGQARSEPPEDDVIQRIQSILAPWDEQEYMLALHVRIARDDAAKRGHAHVGIAELADTLRKLGYLVKMRTALGGGWGGSCLRNLRHTFLAVSLAPDAPGGPPKTLLVDPKFREQFEIAHSTPRYSRILANVPAEAVSPPERISRAVEVLCSEMAAAFAEIGTSLPPWRQAAAMLSKWQPRRSEEVDVTRDSQALLNAAALNNAIGGAPPPSTVAHKLAMLGIEPAPRGSPISEGNEEIDTWSTASDEALPYLPSPNDTASMSLTPHDSGGESDDIVAIEGFNRAATANEGAYVSAARPIGGERIWEGIKEAVAEQAARRSTWA